MYIDYKGLIKHPIHPIEDGDFNYVQPYYIFRYSGVVDLKRAYDNLNTTINIFASSLPNNLNDNVVATFEDDTVILAKQEDIKEAFNILQKHIDLLQNWLNKWKIQINPKVRPCRNYST